MADEELDFLSADQILNVDDLKREVVPVPEWKGKVMVRGATALERDDYDNDLFVTDTKGEKTVTTPNLANAKARLVVKCIIDPKTGQRLFPDTKAGELGRKSAGVINRLFQKIQTLSGLDKKSQAVLEGNSGGGTQEGSPSNLPPTSEE